MGQGVLDPQQIIARQLETRRSFCFCGHLGKGLALKCLSGGDPEACSGGQSAASAFLGLGILRRIPPGYQCLFVTIATPLPLQNSMPAEEAHFINTKQLKFLLARSRWQVSPPSPGKRC